MGVIEATNLKIFKYCGLKNEEYKNLSAGQKGSYYYIENNEPDWWKKSIFIYEGPDANGLLDYVQLGVLYEPYVRKMTEPRTGKIRDIDSVSVASILFEHVDVTIIEDEDIYTPLSSSLKKTKNPLIIDNTGDYTKMTLIMPRGWQYVQP